MSLIITVGIQANLPSSGHFRSIQNGRCEIRKYGFIILIYMTKCCVIPLIYGFRGWEIHFWHANQCILIAFGHIGYIQNGHHRTRDCFKVCMPLCYVIPINYFFCVRNPNLLCKIAYLCWWWLYWMDSKWPPWDMRIEISFEYAWHYVV